MKVYVANYSLQESFNAECDDPSTAEGGLEAMASPQFARVSQRGLPEFTVSMKEDVEREVIDAFQDDHTEAELRKTFKWTTSGWQTPKEGRPHVVFTLLDKTVKKGTSYGGEVWAMLVIQEVELS